MNARQVAKFRKLVKSILRDQGVGYHKLYSNTFKNGCAYRVKFYCLFDGPKYKRGFSRPFLDATKVHVLEAKIAKACADAGLPVNVLAQRGRYTFSAWSLSAWLLR